MSSWPSAKARRVFAALKRIGWRHDRAVGSHKIMKKDGWADYPFSCHDSEELGPAILAKISKDGPSTARLVMQAPTRDLGNDLFWSR
jgi:predicted RNA binding protein YcfA (HicA-like mRNA interferase family)